MVAIAAATAPTAPPMQAPSAALLPSSVASVVAPKWRLRVSSFGVRLVALQGATTKISNSCTSFEADQALTTAPLRLGAVRMNGWPAKLVR